jgi:hypothetical protein
MALGASRIAGSIFFTMEGLEDALQRGRKMEGDTPTQRAEIKDEGFSYKMSYIIVAEVDTTCEENFHGNKSLVDARILSERDGYINFDIQGKFGEQKERTRQLCNTLIDAGFVSFYNQTFILTDNHGIQTDANRRWCLTLDCFRGAH